MRREKKWRDGGPGLEEEDRMEVGIVGGGGVVLRSVELGKVVVGESPAPQVLRACVRASLCVCVCAYVCFFFPLAS